MLHKKVFDYVLLYFNFFIYSLSSLFLKLASGYDFASVMFIFFYACAIATLFIYAVLWQQVLKNFSLSFAYGNRAIVIPLGMIYGYFIFGEQIVPKMLVGTLIILVGVVLIAGDADEQ